MDGRSVCSDGVRVDPDAYADAHADGVADGVADGGANAVSDGQSERGADVRADGIADGCAFSVADGCADIRADAESDSGAYAVAFSVAYGSADAGTDGGSDGEPDGESDAGMHAGQVPRRQHVGVCGLRRGSVQRRVQCRAVHELRRGAVLGGRVGGVRRLCDRQVSPVEWQHVPCVRDGPDHGRGAADDVLPLSVGQVPGQGRVPLVSLVWR